MNEKKLSPTQKLAYMGMLAALSLVLLFLIKIPFPPAPFLVYDIADIPILIGAFVLGIGPGLGILGIVCFIQAFLMGGDSWVGFLMHFVASGAFLIVAKSIYNLRPSLKSLTIGLAAGCLIMAAVMVPMNLIFTVHFYGQPADVVKAMILPAIIPFNLSKAAINALVACPLIAVAFKFFGKKL